MNELTVEDVQTQKDEIRLETNRFCLRTLTVDDVSDTYLGWMKDPLVLEFIQSAKTTVNKDQIKEFVKENRAKKDVLFFGIFYNEKHIGNIKFDPINVSLGYTVVGVLIGEVEWRKKGVFREVIQYMSTWLYLYRNVGQIVLGVAKNNTAAIAAYRRAGFVEEWVPYFFVDDTSFTFSLTASTNNYSPLLYLNAKTVSIYAKHLARSNGIGRICQEMDVEFCRQSYTQALAVFEWIITKGRLSQVVVDIIPRAMAYSLKIFMLKVHPLLKHNLVNVRTVITFQDTLTKYMSEKIYPTEKTL